MGEAWDGLIGVDDPRAEDVRALLVRHLAFMHAQSPPEDVHALDVDGLLDPAVTFYSARRDGELIALGALKRLDDEHAEVKSMHTVEAMRGKGIAAAMVSHLIAAARARGFRQLNLETGTSAAFAPARALYINAGFRACGPFADYGDSPHSCFMTLDLRLANQLNG
jgi:putative acetyltransferase